MSDRTASRLRKLLAPALGGALALVAVPVAGVALAEVTTPSLVSDISGSGALFTPATVDPALARRVTEHYAARREALPFTPATGKAISDRTVTVAVRVDDDSARAISIRSAIDSTRSEPGRREVAVAPSAFDLGVARGYQSFTKPASELPKSVSRIAMPDLAQFRPSEGARDKPSRFQPRISVDQEATPGRAPRTLEGQGDRRLDVGGSYRVSRNLDVTAGVRYSEEQDRLTPLTDSSDDSQSVYIGTQLRF
ncbi:Rho GTPase-activating protein [Alteriqipengyuania lutimaris]|uniref:Uncharacterized protein n=1 Tax=Alteriqipengyuania lutimaris TaxID=1538146 RepID=A0A395LQA5_9SPHN|nr:hypothetical protein [Alteriqipengyuania lutimaris]MBB3034199.1 hypothetical protein [Alteriqipengyuania lutimaris]RDS76880.1 hypothetical protein DL238_04160 [Alteriqipengyuania lutimaris]